MRYPFPNGRHKLGDMRFIAVLCLLLSACEASPSDCVDKGDMEACNSLCNTGKEEFLPLCYEERARKVAACADANTDCPGACQLWKDAAANETASTAYRAKLGSDAKVAAINAKCGG
jgi:hypothetical protein